MKIRKVDDKPMVIHTKEKAKIHAHEPKGAKIKGSYIYTVERGPKTAGAMLAREKQNMIKEKFKEWLFAEPERRQKYVEYYNETWLISKHSASQISEL